MYKREEARAFFRGLSASYWDIDASEKLLTTSDLESRGDGVVSALLRISSKYERLILVLSKRAYGEHKAWDEKRILQLYTWDNLNVHSPLLGDPPRTSTGGCGQTLASTIGWVGEQTGVIDQMSARTAVMYPLAGWVTRIMVNHETKFRPVGVFFISRPRDRMCPTLPNSKQVRVSVRGCGGS
ncbi:hypothetical protein ABG067_004592 [Albugo candida]